MRFLLFFIFLIQLSYANLIVVDNQQKTEHFTLEYLIDTTNKLTISEVAKLPFSKEIPSQFTLGYTDAPVWFKLHIQNESQQEDLILDFTEVWFSEFNLYTPTTDGFKEQKDGYLAPLNRVNDFDFSPSFHIQILPHESKTYYIKATAPMATFGEFIIYSNYDTYVKDKMLETALYMIYVGGALIVILLNFFLFITLKEKIYLYYSLYVGSMFIFITAQGGFVSHILPFNYEDFQVFTLTGALFLILFSQELLSTKEYRPRMHTFLNIFLVIFVLFIPLFFVDLTFWFNVFNNIVVIVFSTLIYIAISLWRAHNNMAKYYLFVMLIYIGSLAVFALVAEGILQNSNLSRYLYLYASFFEITFFALILANKYNITKKELLEKTLHHEEVLKQEVLARTIELKKAQDKLKELTIRDTLTGLYNRRYLDEIASRTLAYVSREKQNISILMIDIDYFKDVNDNYGHLVGDKILVDVSSILQKLSRANDIVIRYGGEEFIGILSNSNLQEATAIAQRIRTSIEASSSKINETEVLSITVSVGISSVQEYDSSIYDAINRADIALYSAKQNGRNQVCVN